MKFVRRLVPSVALALAMVAVMAASALAATPDWGTIAGDAATGASAQFGTVLPVVAGTFLLIAASLMVYGKVKGLIRRG